MIYTLTVFGITLNEYYGLPFVIKVWDEKDMDLKEFFFRSYRDVRKNSLRLESKKSGK